MSHAAGTACELPEEIRMLEYLPCETQYREQLFAECDNLREYLTRRWLILDFVDSNPVITARHFVGVFPFRCKDEACPRREKHLLLVLPKGCRSDEGRELLPFLELLSLAGGGKISEWPEGFKGQRGAGTFLLLLAHHYSGLLAELCRRDFRLYYQPEEGELRGRIRGRLNVHAHHSNTLRAKAHQVPCRWEEFTPDNWDNRILLAGKRRLERSAGALSAKAGAFIRGQFRTTESRFNEVQEMSVSARDLHRARLWRMSPYYRRAFDWARLILQGLDRPVAGGQAPPLALDANDAFERFAEAVTVKASGQAKGSGLVVEPQAGRMFMSGPQFQTRIPDLLIRDSHGVIAVGDAKYKEVLEGIPTDQLGDLERAIVPRIRPADWNQLYIYMRLTGATRGFFLVPYWRPDATTLIKVPSTQNPGAEFGFTVGPLDGHNRVKIAIFGLNLLRPREVLNVQALAPLTRWILDE